MIAALRVAAHGQAHHAEFPTSASTRRNIMTPERRLRRAEAVIGCAGIAAAPRRPRRTAGTDAGAGPAKKPPPAPKRASSARRPVTPSGSAPTADNNDDLFKAARAATSRDHAPSSHQACRRLRVSQGTQGLGCRRMATARKKGLPLRQSTSHG